MRGVDYALFFQLGTGAGQLGDNVVGIEAANLADHVRFQFPPAVGQL